MIHNLQIIYSVTNFNKNNKAIPIIHHLTYYRYSGYGMLTDYDWYYLISDEKQKRWKKLPLNGKSKRLSAKDGECENGGWYPILNSEELSEKNKFLPNSPTSPILWKLKYKGRLFWHSTYRFFEWKNNKWIPNDDKNYLWLRLKKFILNHF